MSSYAPPPGPPPPTVPEGWKAQYDERYQTWFYINIATGKSQWERPEAPPPSGPPAGPPPNELPAEAVSSDKKQPMASNNPYNPANSSAQGAPTTNTLDDDARLAAKLQAEEDSRARSQGGGDRGAASDYYSDPSAQGQGGPPSYGGAGPSQSQSQSPLPQSQSPMPEQKRSKGGFLSKLMGKASSSSSSRPPHPQQQQYASYPQHGPPPGGYYGGGYPPAQPGYGYGPQAGYGGGYGGGYPPQGGYYPQQPPRKSGGMGTAGAAALGVGGGLLGGLLIADAVEDLGDHDYDNGGGDWGGGDDFGGGDF